MNLYVAYRSNPELLTDLILQFIEKELKAQLKHYEHPEGSTYDGKRFKLLKKALFDKAVMFLSSKKLLKDTTGKLEDNNTVALWVHNDKNMEKLKKQFSEIIKVKLTHLQNDY